MEMEDVHLKVKDIFFFYLMNLKYFQENLFQACQINLESKKRGQKMLKTKILFTK